ncbi:MAG: CHAD domain-containing protein [Proteobacteria bacterium]|nr:CHAD domain-containing protein [Pseudomonadota bacterium]
MTDPTDDLAPGATGTPEHLSLSAQALALSALRHYLSDWIHHEPGARRGQDPEELHQLRVAARRIEATLGLLRDQLPSRLAGARTNAKGVLRMLGAARDLDVQLEELRTYCEDLPEAERAAALPLEARLEEQRGRARTRMVAALDSEATRHWLEALDIASVEPGRGAGRDAPRALTVMPERIKACYRKLRKAVGSLHAASAPDDFHRVRRRAKRLRYALECGRELYGRPADDVLKSLRRLQEELGHFQDANMARARLAVLAGDSSPLPPQTLFLMGRLAERHAHGTRGARKRLERSWRKLRGRRWKALRARMSELAAEAQAMACAPQDSAAVPLADADRAASALRH